MTRKRLIQISLSRLLIIVTLVALLLGFVVWRKHETLAKFRAYRDIGLAIRVDVGHFTVKPISADILVVEIDAREYRIARKQYDWEQVQLQLRTLIEKAHNLGIDNVNVRAHLVTPRMKGWPPKPDSVHKEWIALGWDKAVDIQDQLILFVQDDLELTIFTTYGKAEFTTWEETDGVIDKQDKSLLRKSRELGYRRSFASTSEKK